MAIRFYTKENLMFGTCIACLLGQQCLTDVTIRTGGRRTRIRIVFWTRGARTNTTYRHGDTRRTVRPRGGPVGVARLVVRRRRLSSRRSWNDRAPSLCRRSSQRRRYFRFTHLIPPVFSVSSVITVGTEDSRDSLNASSRHRIVLPAYVFIFIFF